MRVFLWHSNVSTCAFICSRIFGEPFGYYYLDFWRKCLSMLQISQKYIRYYQHVHFTVFFSDWGLITAIINKLTLSSVFFCHTLQFCMPIIVIMKNTCLFQSKLRCQVSKSKMHIFQNVFLSLALHRCYTQLQTVSSFSAKRKVPVFNYF